MKYSASNMRMWSRLGPSGALGAAAMEIGSLYENALFLSADMSFAAGLDRFRNKYPDRHYEFGIAEQNLVGAAAGLASEGFDVFAVTYATFFATRALDQVKMCLGYMKLPVKMIGLNGGFGAGILGPTHMALEDIAAMRSIPNITIVSPADTTETVKAMLAAAQWDGPLFIRLTGEMNQPQVYSEDYEFEIGKAVTLREGKQVSIVSTGAVTYNCLQAAEKLQQFEVDCSVINVHTIKPLDEEAINKAAKSDLIVTVEEHNQIGGLGSAVADFLIQRGLTTPMLRLGVHDYYPHAGSYQFLLQETGLDADGITRAIVEKLKSRGE